MRFTILAAALVGALACGSDTHSGDSKVPITYECPRTAIRPRAIVAEDMAGKKMVEKTLSFTFDSGPSEATQALEQYLASKQVRATFFITGGNATGQETTLDLLKTDGHLVANRTQTDDDVTTLAAADLIKSVQDTDAFVKTRAPDGKLYFRPPYGAWNEAAQKTLAGSDMNKYTGPVGWDMGDNLADGVGSDLECWDTNKTAQECADLVLKQIRDKKTGIVLLHDGPPGIGTKVVDMIKLVIDPLKTEGFKFARLDELNLVPRSQTFPGDDPGGTDPAGGPTSGGTTSGGEPGAEDPCKQ
jgi:peptidoglycan/xylan/chitin deacetylase (PgdA/CDA1 family)